jgi:FkbM family methyltransferase
MYSGNPLSYGALAAARSLLAQNPEARNKLLDCLIDIEKSIQAKSTQNVREDLTGPITDLLFEHGEALARQVSNGMTFNFRYSSKIARDFMLAREKAPDHVWEPQTTRSVVSLAKGQHNVIIGGAYFGDHALFVARALAQGGVCHCFELSSDNIEMLRSNLAANGVGNIKIVQEALWSSDDDRIALDGADSHASPKAADNTNASGTFTSRTIDRYVETAQLKSVDVIMLDIEGGEFAALQGARKVLARDRATAPALICEIHRHYVDWSNGLRATPMCALLIDHGYEVFAIRDYQGNQAMPSEIVELIDIDTAVISGPPHGFNLLAVKSRDRLDPNVFRIVHGVSPKLLHHRDPKIFAPLASGHERP